MRKIREVLRLKYECGRSQRQIAASCAIGLATVSEYVGRARAAGLTWEAAKQLSDAELERLLFRDVGRNEPMPRAPIDFEWIHRELRRPGVTLQLLWMEYQEALAARGGAERPYQYSQFCELYAGWRSTLAVTMRQVHRAGEKAFVDYSGNKPRIVDRATGEVRDAELFVMVLGASNYTYAEATWTQKVADFVASTIRALEYFGCAPQVLVPDQLRSAVKGPDRYEPDVNPTYREMAEHYGMAVIPARPRKPRDKAKVEAGVLVAQRWILACLRNRVFYSLDELNEAIAEQLERLNTRPFKKLEGCRRSAFESLDRPAMRALPSHRYELAEWKKAKVNVDYHVDFEGRHYSVSHTLVGVRVEIRATASTVEVFHGQARVASHRRSYGAKGTYVTLEAHRPRRHADYGRWPPERMIEWASSFGPNVARVVEKLMARYPHPELGYRAALGMIRCAQKYGAESTDAACARALAASTAAGLNRKYVEAMLKKRLHDVPAREPSLETSAPRARHENIRGADYYDKEH